MSGPYLDVTPKHALALSLAVHELATNAIKYGSLTRGEGRVAVQWFVQEGLLTLHWEERGGPAVTPPTRKSFGTKLLEDILIRDLGGSTELNYDPSGLRCIITAAL
jgi:chemotaxis family two-component system sensor kinase Cph1